MDTLGSTGLIGVSRDYFSLTLQIEKRRKRDVSCHLSALGYRQCNDDRLTVRLVRECVGTFDTFALRVAKLSTSSARARCEAMELLTRLVPSCKSNISGAAAASLERSRCDFFDNSFCLRVCFFPFSCSLFFPLLLRRATVAVAGNAISERENAGKSFSTRQKFHSIVENVLARTLRVLAILIFTEPGRFSGRLSFAVSEL